MMTEPTTWFDVWMEFAASIQEQEVSKSAQAARVLNEMRSAILRIVLPLFGFKRKSSGKKMIQKDVADGMQFLKTLPISNLKDIRTKLQKSLAWQVLSKSSQNTYGGRISQWLNWMEEHGYLKVSIKHSARIQAQLSPKTRFGYGSCAAVKLTSRRGLYPEYILQWQEMSPAMQSWQNYFVQFLTKSKQPGRVNTAIGEAGAYHYLKELNLFWGWMTHVRHPRIPTTELTVDLLFPLVTEEELEELSPLQQEKLWRKHQLEFQTWLGEYHEYLKEEGKSQSPHTWKGKLSALKALGRVQYADQVQKLSDYEKIPLFVTLNNFFREVFEELDEWSETGQSVADWSKKWPEVPEGKTALEVVQEKVIEGLRLECRLRRNDGEFRNANWLAVKYMHFLKFALSGLMPARRQQEDRSAKIALSCPVQRPDFVPPDGLYYPLPPDETREKNPKKQVSDNFIYRTYQLNHKHYPEGIWVRDTQGYKTRKKYGSTSIVIPNPTFADGYCLYDYIEAYLEGIWAPEGQKNCHLHDWSWTGHAGKRGRWFTSGRAEFQPHDRCVLPTSSEQPIWTWGYFFVTRQTGMPYEESGYAKSIRNNSFRLIGKKITPHTMRYLWASWGVMVGLSDAEMRSLAYAMGHSVETLRNMYERCTPQQKRQLIEDAIKERLLDRLSGKATDEPAVCFNQLLKLASRLNQEDQLRLIQQLQTNLLAG